jgi:hypothetical protein
MFVEFNLVASIQHLLAEKDYGIRIQTTDLVCTLVSKGCIAVRHSLQNQSLCVVQISYFLSLSLSSTCAILCGSVRKV